MQRVVVMSFIEGTSRNQTAYWAMDDMVEEESMVRVIDLFIDKCDLGALGFTRTEPAATGRPGYAAASLAKLYVYGYENKIRSSRKLEKECRRNVEVMWLTDGLTPDHKSISEFRRLNLRPLQKLFREFVKLCKSWELVGGEFFAVDGSKFKASNNKKNNFSSKKLDERLMRLEGKIAEYLESLDEEDNRDDAGGEAPEGLIKLLKRRELYESYKAQLEESGEKELSTVDPDAKLMSTRKGCVEAAYNVQSSVDGKHDIIVDYDVSKNSADQGHLSIMAKRLMRQGYRKFTLLADKGYYNGSCLQKGKKFKIKAIVARQKPSNPTGQPKEFHTDSFRYDPKTDKYICPSGAILHAHSKKTAKRRNFFNKTACSKCPHLDSCTSGERGYRSITRGEYADDYERTDRVYNENIKLYKRRQQIVEHPFGTVKHTMDGGYFLLRRRRKVRTEVALLFLGYNLKRAYNILGFRAIMERLSALSIGLLQLLRVFDVFRINSALLAKKFQP